MQPVTLHQRRQYIIALMWVAGMPSKYIADKLGLTPQTVNTITRSELFQAYAMQLRKELRETSLGSLMSRIEQESMPSLEIILGIRDGNIVDPAVARVQLDAAKYVLGDLHLDRTMPKITRQEREDVVHITFPPEVLKQMFSAVAEDQGKPLELHLVEPAQITQVKPKTVALESVDAVIEDLEAKEDEQLEV